MVNSARPVESRSGLEGIQVVRFPFACLPVRRDDVSDQQTTGKQETHNLDPASRANVQFPLPLYTSNPAMRRSSFLAMIGSVSSSDVSPSCPFEEIFAIRVIASAT